MSDPVALNTSTENFDNMTVAEFEERLPDLFGIGGGKVSSDPRFAIFLKKNPDCAALVSDLETIAEQAKSLFEPAEDQEPADSIWANIASKLAAEPNATEEPEETLEPLEEPDGILE
jgi:hypothetical protein